MTRANGRLANSFVSQCAPYYAPFFFAKIVNDYSCSFLNPYFGANGAIFFFGGGHAATNDNSVCALILGQQRCEFRRMIDPSPIFGRSSDEATRMANSRTSAGSFIDPVYAEYKVDGQPAAPHSYSSGDFLGPSEGGAAQGSFLRVLNTAVGVIGVAGAEAAHQVDFADQVGPYRWRRVTDNVGLHSGPGSNPAKLAPANWTAWVASQDRVYTDSRAGGSGRPPTWFDRGTLRWVTGTGALRLNDAEQGAVSGAMFHVPERELLIFCDCKAGRLRIQTLDTSQAQPSWQAGVVLSQPVLLQPEFGSACWCSHNGRILVGELFADDASIAEIQIPARLTDPWAVARAPFGNGQRIRWATNASYKKWSYNPRIRAVVYMPSADPGGLADEVFVYRPRGT